MSKADHGVYEQIIDLMLRRKLDREVGDAIRILVRTLDVSDSHLRLARHLEKVLRTALRQAGRADDKIEAQLAITNELIRTLAHHPNLEHLSENLVDSPGEELLEVWPTEQPSRQRPTTPLSDSSLFTGSRSDPSLASELRREIASADEIDILVSFVKWSGLRLITDELQTFTARKNTKLRVITTSYSPSGKFLPLLTEVDDVVGP